MTNPISKDKLNAAYLLLHEDTTTFEKLEKIRILLKGIDPKIDKTLETLFLHAKNLKKLHKGNIIELAAEHLPDNTPENKKRKKLLLLLISTWNSLKSEVKRIKEIYKSETAKGGNKANIASRIFSFAKGPLGLITVAAAAIAAGAILLDKSSVNIVIKNQGCNPITPIVNTNISIPGLKLPTNTIPSGGEETAIVPPLTFSVDGTREGKVILHAYLMNMEYKLQNKNIDVIFNKNSLLGKNTSINLSSSKTHELVLRCR